MALNPQVRNALKRKSNAIIDLEIRLQSLRTNTSADDPINSSLQMLANEEATIQNILDNDRGATIDAVSPADAMALQNAVKAAEDAIEQTASVQNALNAAAVLIGTIKQSKAA